MEPVNIVDVGTVAILVAGFVGLWRSHQKQGDYIQTLLTMQIEQTKCLELAAERLDLLTAAHRANELK